MSNQALDAPGTPVRELDPYLAIGALAELGLELAGQGRIEELESLADRWELLTAGLPDRPPPSARPLLERATLIHERTQIELLRLREALVAELAAAGRVERAAHGYTPPEGRHPRLDRCA